MRSISAATEPERTPRPQPVRAAHRAARRPRPAGPRRWPASGAPGDPVAVLTVAPPGAPRATRPGGGSRQRPPRCAPATENRTKRSPRRESKSMPGVAATPSSSSHRRHRVPASRPARTRRPTRRTRPGPERSPSTPAHRSAVDQAAGSRRSVRTWASRSSSGVERGDAPRPATGRGGQVQVLGQALDRSHQRSGGRQPAQAPSRHAEVLGEALQHHDVGVRAAVGSRGGRRAVVDLVDHEGRRPAPCTSRAGRPARRSVERGAGGVGRAGHDHRGGSSVAEPRRAAQPWVGSRWLRRPADGRTSTPRDLADVAVAGVARLATTATRRTGVERRQGQEHAPADAPLVTAIRSGATSRPWRPR